MQPGRHSPRFSPPAPRLSLPFWGRRHRPHPRAGFPRPTGKNRKTQGIGWTRPHSCPRGPSYLDKVCLQTKATSPVLPAPTFARAGPPHPEQKSEALPCTPDPSEGQEDSIADDLANSQALVWALAEVPLPRQGAVLPQARAGEARPPLAPAHFPPSLVLRDSGELSPGRLMRSRLQRHRIRDDSLRPTPHTSPTGQTEGENLQPRTHSASLPPKLCRAARSAASPADRCALLWGPHAAGWKLVRGAGALSYRLLRGGKRKGAQARGYVRPLPG